jgi:hypothetical protein
MRPWLKWTLGIVAVLLLVWLTIGGITAYYVFRHLETRTVTEPQTRGDFEAVRARFGSRPPLIEVVDARAGDVRVNRLPGPAGAPVDTMHVLTWKAEDGGLLKTEAPLWLMRFNTLTMLSRLGITPARFSLTLDDIRRYGPGIVVDYGPPGGNHVMIWVD